MTGDERDAVPVAEHLGCSENSSRINRTFFLLIFFFDGHPVGDGKVMRDPPGNA
jgi:hypothetical protein